MTPRESLTASRPLRLPGVIFISSLRPILRVRYLCGVHFSMAGSNQGCSTPVRRRSRLENDDQVLARACGRGAGFAGVGFEIFEQFAAEEAEPRQRTERAFLQAFVRVDRVEDDALVVVDHAGAEIFGAAGFALQLGELVEHFLLGGVESPEESLVEFLER